MGNFTENLNLGNRFRPPPPDPQAQSEVKLPNEMILCTGVYGELHY